VGFAGAHETLNLYMAETWVKSHAVTLAAKTACDYASLHDLHIEPYLGELELIELSPDVIARWQADRIADGAGRVAVLQALDLLGGILRAPSRTADSRVTRCGWCGRSPGRGARRSGRSRP
jgi:hypothetical protein